MPSWISISILWLSPAAITAACVACGLFANAMRQGFGPHKPAAPIILATLILWLLHAGYLLAPWLYSTDRRVLAFWLMIPAAVAALGLGIFLSTQFAFASGGPEGDRTHGTLFLLGFLAAILVYTGPIVVVASSGAEMKAQHR
jgi:hypothetical protein